MSDPLLALREYAKLAPWNIRDLAALAGAILDVAGVTPINAAAQSRPSDRTIRFYVARDLMSPPEGRGTAATYSYRHLLQLLGIKLRQMEGATLTSIAKDLAESPGDVLEKRVASALGDLPAPDQLNLRSAVAPRGRVGRVFAQWAGAGLPQPAGGAPDAAPWSATPLERGAWYRLAVSDGVEIAIRHDHPTVRSAVERQRLAEAVLRAVRELREPQA